MYLTAVVLLVFVCWVGVYCIHCTVLGTHMVNFLRECVVYLQVRIFQESRARQQ